MAAFHRDRFTWLAYFMLGYYSYMQASLGPLMAFLGTELNLNYTERGFHLSAFALGMIFAGLSTDRLALRGNRRFLFWMGGAGMAVFAALITFGKHGIVTVISAFLMAYLGTLLLVMIQATLSDKHGEHRAIALTEANILASVTAAIAPLVVGFGQTISISWRFVFYVGIAAWSIAYLIGHRIHLPEDRGRITVQPLLAKKPLPRAFWAYWLVMFLSVAAEWCMIFWSADFLEKVSGLDKALAATSVSLFFIAVVVGRATGSFLARRINTGRLLLVAILVALIGFPIFWLAREPVLTIAGLMLCGLGIANLFPLTLAAASNTAPDQANAASARVSLSAGLAILFAPQILGSAADLVGIQNAYGILIILLGGILVVAHYANQLSHQNKRIKMWNPI